MHAAFSNYNSILIGDKAAGMGGAATALIGDTSSAAFYNPATLSRLEGNSFSAAVGIYKKFDTIYGKNEDFTKAPLRVNQGFFRSLPASTGNMFHWKDWSVGLSIVVPDYDQFKGDLQSTTKNTSTLSYVDESLWVGAALAKNIDEISSVGLTIYYTARNFSQTVGDRSYPTSGEAQLFTSERTIVENTLVFVLGYHRMLTDQWQFGISLRPSSFRISGTGSYFESYTQYIQGEFKNTNPVSYTGASTSPHVPTKLAIGLFYDCLPELKLSADLSLYRAFSYNDLNLPDVGINYTNRSIINGALGAEYYFKDWLRARGGIFTNFSAHSAPDAELQRPQSDKVDQVGFSANIVFFPSKNMTYTFGGYYSGGRGSSVQRIDQRYQAVEKNQHVFTMLVGSSYNF